MIHIIHVNDCCSTHSKREFRQAGTQRQQKAPRAGRPSAKNRRARGRMPRVPSTRPRGADARSYCFISYCFICCLPRPSSSRSSRCMPDRHHTTTGEYDPSPCPCVARTRRPSVIVMARTQRRRPHSHAAASCRTQTPDAQAHRPQTAHSRNAVLADRSCFRRIDPRGRLLLAPKPRRARWQRTTPKQSCSSSATSLSGVSFPFSAPSPRRNKKCDRRI